MKKIIFLHFFVLALFSCSAQNLVPNSSFETITTCAIGFGQIYKAPPWFQPCEWYGNVTLSSTSDIYNVCATSSSLAVPTNYFGYQIARTGNGYAAFSTGDNTTEYREYIEVGLTSSLVPSKTYYVEFYVSLAEVCTKAVTNIGIYFSTDSLLDATNYSPINYVVPHIENSSSIYLNSKTGWMKVSGFYTATGGENFITIGNFHASTTTNAQFVSGGTTSDFPYYYIDDVAVIDSDSINAINEHSDILDFEIYPNPSSGLFTISYFGFSSANQTNIIISDLLGNTVYSYLITTSNMNIDMTFLPKGIYLLKIENEKTVKVKKLIFQ